MAALKILLLGEFSGLHTNLAEGLRELGHSVAVASNGDSFKKITGDITLPANAYEGKLAAAMYRAKLFTISRELAGYDVVQMISPFVFPLRYFPSRAVIRRLAQDNGRLFLCAAGADAFFWRYGPRVLKYGPWADYLKYDLKSESDPAQSDQALAHNRLVARTAHDVIPIMYDYQASYRDEFGIRPIIPIPINTRRYPFQPRTPGSKLRFFHGISRPGFKGTRYIAEAFDVLVKKYPNDLEYTSAGPMPMHSYVELLPSHDVVVDQTSSYSHGINALISMAIGRTVLGGCEPESLQVLGVSRSPAVNIQPDVSQIVQAVEELLADRRSIEQRGYESSRYVHEHHDFCKVARQYETRWRA